MTGFELGGNWRNGPWQLSANGTVSRAVDEETGERLLRRASWVVNLAAGFDPGAWSAGFEVSVVGPRDDLDINTFERVRLPSYALVAGSSLRGPWPRRDTACACREPVRCGLRDRQRLQRHATHRHRRRRPSLLTMINGRSVAHPGCCLAATVASLLFALAVGSVGLSLPEVWSPRCGSTDAPGADIVRGLRLPRAVSGFAVGAALACRAHCCRRCCAIPLADPYVLGISGGAAVAALLALIVGLQAVAVQGAAVGGALLTLALLFVLARRSLYSSESGSGEQATGSVLLTGVMLASFAAALMSLMLSLAPDGRLRTMVFWLLGDLSGRRAWRLHSRAGVRRAALICWHASTRVH